MLHFHTWQIFLLTLVHLQSLRFLNAKFLYFDRPLMIPQSGLAFLTFIGQKKRAKYIYAHNHLSRRA